MPARRRCGGERRSGDDWWSGAAILPRMNRLTDLWINWPRARQRGFSTQHFATFPGEAEIPVAGQCFAVDVQRDEGSLRGQLRGGRRHLEYCSALIHLVEHRAVDHVAAGVLRVVKLPPPKASAVARNLVKRTGIQVF